MPHTSPLHISRSLTKIAFGVLAILLTSAAIWAQAPAPPNDADQPPPVMQGPGGGGPPPVGPPPAQRGRGGPGGNPPPPGGPHDLRMPPGMWWTNPELVQKLNLTTDQQKKIADTFQQARLKLIDADAALHKEEAIMEPLVASETPEDAKILAQIDKVAQARAELEKTNARMLLGIRHVLTPEQWKTLQATHPQHDQQRGPGGDGPRGPGGDGPRGGGGPGGGGPPPRRPQQE
jgi:Spy/CpxP family protein refolding chaperone